MLFNFVDKFIVWLLTELRPEIAAAVEREELEKEGANRNL